MGKYKEDVSNEIILEGIERLNKESQRFAKNVKKYVEQLLKIEKYIERQKNMLYKN